MMDARHPKVAAQLVVLLSLVGRKTPPSDKDMKFHPGSRKISKLHCRGFPEVPAGQLSFTTCSTCLVTRFEPLFRILHRKERTLSSWGVMTRRKVVRGGSTRQSTRVAKTNCCANGQSRHGAFDGVHCWPARRPEQWQ